MYRSNTRYIAESLFLQPSKVFVRHPSYITAGVWVKISCYKFFCEALKFWRQFLPCATKRTWQSINPPRADIADKTVDLAFGSLILLLREKTGQKGVAKEIGDTGWVMLQFAHKGADFVGDVLCRIRQLSGMDRTFQGMIQIFIRIVFRSIGRQEKHLDFLLVFFQPGRNKLAMMDL